MATPHEWTADERATVCRFAAWMERADVGAIRACKLLGVSRPTLSAMLGCKYPGSVDAICERMRRHLRRVALRELATEPAPFTRTSITDQVIEACNVAHTERTISLVLGPSGVGKTMGLRRYVDQEPEAAYVVAGVGASPQSLLMEVARVLELECGKWRPTMRLRSMISEALAGTGRLLIIDECDYLDEAALQGLRMIHDAAEIGMVWSGTAQFLEVLRARESGTMRQVLRRIAYATQVGRCSEDDLACILDYYELEREVVDAVIEGAHGQAARAVAAVVAARRISGANRALTAETVVRAVREQLLPVEE